MRGGLWRVLLIDGTHVSCRGPQGLNWRVHTAFDLLSGRLSQLKVTDRHEAEHLEVFELHEGDRVITDRANGYRERIAYVWNRLAHLVVRFSPSTLPLEDAAGHAIALVSWLKGRHAPSGRSYSCLVWITQDGQRIPLRLRQQQSATAQRRKQQRLRCTTRQTAQATVTALLLGWALVEEESTTVRLAMAEAMQGLHRSRRQPLRPQGLRGRRRTRLR